MKIIKINSSRFGEKEIFIDDEDFEIFSKYHWFIAPAGKTWYPIANIKVDGKRKKLKLHNLIISNSSGVIDHKDRNGLNCQKDNLRKATHAENCRNRSKRSGSASIYNGVSIHSTKKKEVTYRHWEAAIRLNGQAIGRKLFNFTDQGEFSAAKHYDELAKTNFKEFANLNFK